jgi:CRISPR-associated exonuclease Cas4
MAANSVNEPEQLLISMLEHYSYCPRQCALIHMEDSYQDNVFTLRGSFVHSSVDKPGLEHREGMPVERALPLWSDFYGLRGKADLVEFPDGIPYPVEYKSGELKAHPHAELQLCAEALCLEEMYGKTVPKGAIYFAASRRRQEVEFTKDLRTKVDQACTQIRTILADSRLPPPPGDDRCTHCSLKPVCLPEMQEFEPRLQTQLDELFKPSDDKEQT